MNEENKSIEAPKGGGKTGSQQGIYAKFEPLAAPSIERLKTLLGSKNEAIALGAIKIILAKLVPDRKAVEVTGENGEPIKLIINAGNGFIPSTVTFNAAPSGGYSTGQSPIQSDGVAPESTEDNNGDNRIDKTEPTA